MVVPLTFAEPDDFCSLVNTNTPQDVVTSMPSEDWQVVDVGLGCGGNYNLWGSCPGGSCARMAIIRSSKSSGDSCKPCHLTTGTDDAELARSKRRCAARAIGDARVTLFCKLRVHGIRSRNDVA